MSLDRLLSAQWRDAPDLRAKFESASPFPMLVLDGFLDAQLAEDLMAVFPRPDEMPHSRDYVFGDKHELSSVELHGDAGARFHEMATSPEFASFLSNATGLQVWVDPRFHGGGFHQGADGSYLDMHVDFNIHPHHADWLRTLNVLVYLNREWQDEWGGQLLVKSSPEGDVTAISPLFNRAVIMATDDHTFHGYRRMALPPGVTRKSIATYAYRPTSEGVVAHTTRWVPEDAGVFKRLFAKNYDVLVRTKTKFLGSATSKNR